MAAEWSARDGGWALLLETSRTWPQGATSQVWARRNPANTWYISDQMRPLVQRHQLNWQAAIVKCHVLMTRTSLDHLASHQGTFHPNLSMVYSQQVYISMSVTCFTRHHGKDEMSTEMFNFQVVSGYVLGPFHTAMTLCSTSLLTAIFTRGLHMAFTTVEGFYTLGHNTWEDWRSARV